MHGKLRPLVCTRRKPPRTQRPQRSIGIDLLGPIRGAQATQSASQASKPLTQPLTQPPTCLVSQQATNTTTHSAAHSAAHPAAHPLISGSCRAHQQQRLHQLPKSPGPRNTSPGGRPWGEHQYQMPTISWLNGCHDNHPATNAARELGAQSAMMHGPWFDCQFPRPFQFASGIDMACTPPGMMPTDRQCWSRQRVEVMEEAMAAAGKLGASKTMAWQKPRIEGVLRRRHHLRQIPDRSSSVPPLNAKVGVEAGQDNYVFYQSRAPQLGVWGCNL